MGENFALTCLAHTESISKTMNPYPIKLDALGYLLGGVGLLAMSFLVVPGLLVVPTIAGRVGLVAVLVLGACALWWAMRRFTAVGERVAAVGGYVLVALINGVMLFASI